MCKCLSKESLKSLGLITTLLYIFLTIICIFVQGYDYQQLDMRWTNTGEWRVTASLQVSAVVIVVAFCILGLMAFTCLDHGAFPVVYCVLACLSGIFSFIVCVFTLTAGAVWKNDSTLGCNMDYWGVFSYFRYIDKYFHYADSLLCTTACPCYFSNKTALQELTEYYRVKGEFDGTGNVINGAVNFDQCPEKIKAEATNLFIKNIDAIDYIGKFNAYQFGVYWRRIEKKFKCVGWCKTDYKYEVKSNTFSGSLKKHLFWDVNAGPVHNVGCMKRMLDWLPKMLNTFGSTLLIISVAQITSAIFAFSLGCNFSDDNDINPTHMDKGDDNQKLKTPSANNLPHPDQEQEMQNME